jgi:hypothetical protein
VTGFFGNIMPLRIGHFHSVGVHRRDRESF